LKAMGGVLVIAGFLSFVYKQKKGSWPWLLLVDIARAKKEQPPA